MNHTISVIGCGYLGAVHAVSMASLGHQVVGFDVNPDTIAKLSAGVPPFHEAHFDGLLTQGLADGRLTFSGDPAALAAADVHFIGVGTPQKDASGQADLSYLNSAIDTLISVFRGRTEPLVIVGKSTVPVGTAAAIQARLDAELPCADLIWNPEFLREGYGVEDTLRPDRVVYGLSDNAERAEAAAEVLDSVYAGVLSEGMPRLIVSYESAELIKVSANSFLATKISFINAIAEICEASGADVGHVAQAIGLDDRIGAKFLRAGIGFGGGCLPKDIRAFMASAHSVGRGESLNFLREIDAINQRRRARCVELAEEMTGGLDGARVTVLGAAFKPLSDDLRDSPAIDIACQLVNAGAHVTITDIAANDKVRQAYPQLVVVDSTKDALRGAEVVLVLTEWAEYASLSPSKVKMLVAHPRIIDGRNALDHHQWLAAGWDYRGMGRTASQWPGLAPYESDDEKIAS